MNSIINSTMKVLIKPRPELVKLLSKEHVRTGIRQLIEPNADLLFYDEIEHENREQIIKEIKDLCGGVTWHTPHKQIRRLTQRNGKRAICGRKPTSRFNGLAKKQTAVRLP